MKRAIALSACILSLFTCSKPNDDARAAPGIRGVPNEQTHKSLPTFAPVVLITIDGARYQDIFGAIDDGMQKAEKTEARMPALRELVTVKGAAIGAPGYSRIDATGPNFVSMPGYTEIFTGRAPECANNECESPRVATMLDDLTARGAKVAVFASWEKIARATSSGSGRFLVSAGKQDGDSYEPYPGCGEYRPDHLTEDRAIEFLESQSPDLLVIDLGDPDEYAHRGDHRGYVRSLGEIDAFLERLENKLIQQGPRGLATTIFLTSDHGRAKNFRDHGGEFPESSRTWLAVGGPRVTARGFVTTHDHHLADIASTLVAVSTREADVRDTTLAELFEERALTLR